MFFEPPEGLEDCFRFLWNPSEAKVNTDGEEGFRFAGTVVVPSKTKLELERIIAETLELGEIEIPLRIDIGSSIEGKVEANHEKNIKEESPCPDSCFCKFDTERYWGHHVYHLLLGTLAGLIGIEKEILLSSPSSHNIELDDFIREKRSGYIGRNEWYETEKIGEFAGSVEYILFTILDSNYQEHFKLGNLDHLTKDIVVNKTPFEDCKNGNCKFNNGKPLKIWESRSNIQTPDPNYRPIRGWAPHKLQENRPTQKMIEAPMASIEQVDCICSSSKYYFRLVNNEFTTNKERASPEVRIIHKYTDIRNEKEVSDEETIRILLSRFYANILPKKQADVAAKIIRGQILDNKERHSKFLLRKNLEKMENVMAHWPDIERLRGDIKKTKSVE